MQHGLTLLERSDRPLPALRVVLSEADSVLGGWGRSPTVKHVFQLVQQLTHLDDVGAFQQLHKAHAAEAEGRQLQQQAYRLQAAQQEGGHWRKEPSQDTQLLFDMPVSTRESSAGLTDTRLQGCSSSILLLTQAEEGG